MTLAALRRYRLVPLNLRAEPDDVIYAGARLANARLAAVDAATAATARGDTAGAATWTLRASALATAQEIAPGATGLRYREDEGRVHFIVPDTGHVQSIEPDEFITLFADTADPSGLYAGGIESVFVIVDGWGWRRV